MPREGKGHRIMKGKWGIWSRSRDKAAAKRARKEKLGEKERQFYIAEKGAGRNAGEGENRLSVERKKREGEGRGRPDIEAPAPGREKRGKIAARHLQTEGEEKGKSQRQGSGKRNSIA